jgi:hypothetical protein
MIKRVVVLGAVAAALVVPAASLADGGGGSMPTTAAKGGHAAAVLDRVARRVDRRFAVFSTHCLAGNAPERCTKAANRLVRRLDRLQHVLNRVESTIKQKCGAANPPARCASAPQVTGAIDALLGKIASDVAAIKAAFPNAGA